MELTYDETVDEALHDLHQDEMNFEFEQEARDLENYAE